MTPALISKLTFFGLLTIAVFLEVIADIFFKKWSVGNRTILLAVGFALYFSGTVFWAISLKYEFLSKAVLIFTLLNLLLISLVGTMIFKENLSLVNKIGIGLGVLSIILVEIF